MKKNFRRIFSLIYVLILLIAPVNSYAGLNETGFWVATGHANNTLAYSLDGLTWTGVGASIFSVRGQAVAWNGSRFVAAGLGTNTLAYSDDGITWTGLGTSIFSSEGKGVAWNGTLWVAVGSGTNTIAYSADGITWTPVINSTSIFSTASNAVAWNGSRFVAAGQGTNSLAYSDDGITWTGVTGTSIFSATGLGIASNGSLWVATGQGTNTLAYSADGITWTGLGTSIFSSISYAVAWNGSRWVSAGTGTNTLAYSDDGISWTGLGTSTFSISGRGVAWNGTMWVAVGNINNTIAYSSDGITWTPVTNSTSTFATRGNAVASAPAPSLFPAQTAIVTTYTLTYTAGTGGTISGTTPQTVNENADGSTVTAVPDAGYTFTSWSDSVLTASRTDLDVTSDITVTASFTEIQSNNSSGSRPRSKTANVPVSTEPVITTPTVQVVDLTTPATTNYTFTRTLRIKDTGEDIKELQKYLNTHGYPVAITGPGSMGNETTKFGLLTHAAVIKLQTTNNLVPDGIVGPLTRAFLR